MYRHNLPLQSQDDLAYALGLTVPTNKEYLFKKARTGKRPSAGWGTQINLPEFEINKVLSELGMPLHVDVDSEIHSIDELRTKLQAVGDGDALLCFDYGKLWGEDVQAGHVCVFDRLEGDDVWIVDPLPEQPKHRKASLQNLMLAIDFHGPHNSTGIWNVTVRS